MPKIVECTKEKVCCVPGTLFHKMTPPTRKIVIQNINVPVIKERSVFLCLVLGAGNMWGKTVSIGR